MPSPSQLSIATSAVNRLLKEEVTYRKELADQEQRLKQMQDAKDDDENRDFNIEQGVRTPFLLQLRRTTWLRRNFLENVD